MARAVTSGELALLRSDNQSSKLKAYIYNPSALATATVGSLPVDNDKVTSIALAGGAGPWTDTIDGMTVLIGTSAGAADVGIVRARYLSGGTLYIGETSAITWAVGQHVTLLPEFSLWAKPLTLAAGVWNLEGETAYSDQNKLFNPLPVLGPLVYVGKLATGSAVISPDASASWLPGGTITGYAWAATGATVTNGTTATPTITYTTAGHYVISCTVTGSNGKTFTGYRAVIIEGTGITAGYEDARLDSCAGDSDSGGWSFTLTVFESAAASGLIRDRALCVVVADDTYGTTAQSIGYVTGQERVLVAGWIDGESIASFPQYGTVQFTARGPAGWAAACSAWPMSIMHTDDDPTDWMHIKDFDLQKAQWFWAMWRSTAARFMDVYPLDDDYNVSIFDASSGTNDLWAQCKVPADKIAGLIACDRYGRMYFEPDAQLIEPASRSGIPVVMEVSKEDWREDITIERRLAKPVALLETGSISNVDGEWQAVLSRAPGNAMHRTGGVKSRFNFAFTGQTQANTVTGLLAGKENNPWQNVRLPLAANNRMIDIVPLQYVTLTIAAADNPRGVTWTSQALIPRSVELMHKMPSGVLLADVTCEVVTLAENSVTLEPPAVPDINLPDIPDIDMDFPLIPKLDYGVVDPFTPPEPPPDPNSTCLTNYAAAANGPVNLGVHGIRDTSYPIVIYRRFGLRTTSHTNQTRYEIRGRFQEFTGGVWVDTTDDTFYTVYAICDDGTAVAGVKDAVSNPNRRTGTLPLAEAAGKVAKQIQIVWSASYLFHPDTITFSMDAAGLDETGTQEWWYDATGLRGVWKNIRAHWGYPHFNRWIAIEPSWTSGAPTLPLPVKMHMSITGADGITDLTDYTRTNPLGINPGGYGMGDSLLGINGDIASQVHFYVGGNIYPNPDLGYWKYWTWSSGGFLAILAKTQLLDHDNWAYYSYSDYINFNFQLRFTPARRIAFDSVTLWNVCPATS